MTRKLDDITKDRGNNGLRMLITGGSGVGKTTTAANAPSPIFISTEDGLNGLKDVAAFPLATHLVDHVYGAMGVLLNEQHEYKTVVLDSLDWCEPLVWQKVCDDNNWPSIESPGYGRGYVEAVREWRVFLNGCDALVRKGLNVILICHAQPKRIDAPDTDSYDSYQPKLNAKASALMLEWADVCGYATHKIITRKADNGFGNSKNKAISSGERILKLESAPSHCAKNRYGLKDCPLSWADFEAALSAATNHTTN